MEFNGLHVMIIAVILILLFFVGPVIDRIIEIRQAFKDMLHESRLARMDACENNVYGGCGRCEACQDDVGIGKL